MFHLVDNVLAFNLITLDRDSGRINHWRQVTCSIQQ